MLAFENNNTKSLFASLLLAGNLSAAILSSNNDGRNAAVSTAAELNEVSAESASSDSRSIGWHAKILANGTDTYRIKFAAGASAMVLISGDKDTDPDLYVYKADGSLVDSDTDNTDTCVCAWKPSSSSYCTIKIVNRGSVYNAYTIGIIGVWKN